MKQLFLTVLTFLCFSACEEPNKTTDIETKHDSTQRISYFKDPHTNLCFAKISSWTYGRFYVVSFTCVPCTREVLSQIK
jgi:hypothetical protein